MTKFGQNFTVFSGDDCTPRFSVTGSGGAGEAMDTASLIWVVFDSPIGGSVLRKTTDTANHFTVSGSIVDVNVSGSDTSGLVGDYYHELQARRAADGKVQTAAVGWVTFNRDLVT